MLQSELTADVEFSSIAGFLHARRREWANMPALYARNGDDFEPTCWDAFGHEIESLAQGLLSSGLRRGDKVAFFAPNSYEFLCLELAVMSLGMVSVPLFADYKRTMINELLRLAEVQALVVANAERDALVADHPSIRLRIRLDGDGHGAVSYRELLEHRVDAQQLDAARDRVGREDQALLMFTSGTMSLPKGVQLTHGNLLSQQEALAALWRTAPGGRTLSYLPWHHSFGGIFEKFFALYSGTALGLDDSRGRDLALLKRNWTRLQPTYFFSVPKIFQELVSACDEAWSRAFFHPDLRFVFTAGAPLPGTVSDVFDRHGVPVLEGWGLTETSPCCTLTRIGAPRVPGVVGFPIPNVVIDLDEDGEIHVKGPNVMTGYYRNEEANARVFTADGYFRTGDLGEVTELGLKILSRKDRIFKLANAEKVNPTAIESRVVGHCAFIKHVLVLGSGERFVGALIFPNREMIAAERRRDHDGCVHPRSTQQLSSCLRACLAELNGRLSMQFDAIAHFVIVDAELEIDKGELTPSLKLNSHNVMRNFGRFVEPLFDRRLPRPPDAIYVDVKDLETAV